MDPLSIAASVAGITSTCLSTGKAIYDFSCKYQDAPRNMVAISSEAAVISASLSQIQALILTKQNPEQLLRSRPEIAATLDTSLTGCMVLFTCLDEELREVSRHARGANSLSWRGKVKTAWKQDKFQELLDGIRGQQTAINTLIQLLQMDSLMEITQLLQQKAPELKQSVERTESLRRSHPSVRMKVAESIFSQEDRMSVYSAADSMMASSEIEFDFDDIIVNSAAYRRALMAAKRQNLAPHTEETHSDLIDLSDDATLRRAPMEDRAEDVAAISSELLGLSFSTDVNESTFSLDILAELQQVQGASSSRDIPVIVPIEAPAKVEVKRKPVTSQGQDNLLSSDADILVRSRTTTPIPSSPTPYVTRSRSTSTPDDAPPPKAPDTPKSQHLEIDQSPKPTQSPSLSPQTNAKRTSDPSNLDSKFNEVFVKSGAYRPASPRAKQKPSLTRTCGKCQKPLTGQFVRALGKTYHLECFTCQDCGKIVASQFFPAGDPPYEYPLCETDYFKRLDLLCYDCGGALRGYYITALDRHYHIEHFHCAACTHVFGAEDSYYEVDNRIYCYYHYICGFAQICTSCHLPILKQFIEIFRNGANQHWHPECYIVHKYWNVRLGAIFPVKKIGDSWKDQDGHEANTETMHYQCETAEATIVEIWSVLSSYEESAAASISEILLAVSEAERVACVRAMWSFLAKIGVIFRALDNIDKRKLQSGVNAGPSYAREAKLLSRKCVALMIESSGFDYSKVSAAAPTAPAKGVTQERLSLVTGLAHYLKLLVRIGLTASLSDLQPFLQDMSQDDDNPGSKAISSMASADNNRCASCKKMVEDACYKSTLGQLWHQGCLECSSCHRPDAFVAENSSQGSTSIKSCRFCGAELMQGYYRVTRLQQFGRLLWMALAGYILANKIDFSVLDDIKLERPAKKDSLALARLVEDARAAASKQRGSDTSRPLSFSGDEGMFTVQSREHSVSTVHI